MLPLMIEPPKGICPYMHQPLDATWDMCAAEDPRKSDGKNDIIKTWRLMVILMSKTTSISL
jgi:hypothetical protein